MNTSKLGRWLAALLIGALVAVADFAAPGAGASGPQPVDGVLIVDTVDGAHAESVPVTDEVGASVSRPDDASPPEGAALQVGAGIYVTYNEDAVPPPEVQTIVDRAVAQWNAALETTVPVEVHFYWTSTYPGSTTPLPNGALGLAGPRFLFPVDGEAALVPGGLANQIYGYDLTDDDPEILLALNRNVAGWYIGEGTPSFSEIDLHSVILHELAHGLGFLGNARQQNLDPASHVRYDTLVSHRGSSLLSLANRNSLLVSGDLDIEIGGGNELELYAPGSWQEGSSFSHFDEQYRGSEAGSLMTPVLDDGEVQRDLDGGVLGVMSEMGWGVAYDPPQPTITSLFVGSGTADVQWRVDLGETVVPPRTFRLEAFQDDVLVGSTRLPGSARAGQLTGLPSGAVEIRLTPEGPNGDGPAASTVPGSVSPVAVSGAGLRQTVTWAQASGYPADSYDVQISADGSSWSALTSTGDRRFTTEPLAEGVWQFRVRGTASTGAGPWTYSLPVGVSEGTVRPLPLDGQVARLYQAYFLRDADADTSGFTYWRTVRAESQPLGSISDAFADSPEFRQTYGSLDDAEFVRLVYRNVLDRSPDAEGLAFWTGRLATDLTRGEVMVGFSESPEFIALSGTTAPTTGITGAVNRLYFAFFLRYPDAAGLAYWSDQVTLVGLEAVAESFTTQPEFTERYGSLSDAAFVDLVYRNVLGRLPDSTGRAHWLGQLGAGVSRGEMMTGFSESTEFILSTGTMPR